MTTATDRFVRPRPSYGPRTACGLARSWTGPGQKRERLTLTADEVLEVPASFRRHPAGPQRQLRRGPSGRMGEAWTPAGCAAASRRMVLHHGLAGRPQT